MYNDYYDDQDEELIEVCIEELDGQEFLESLMFNGFDR